MAESPFHTVEYPGSSPPVEWAFPRWTGCVHWGNRGSLRCPPGESKWLRFDFGETVHAKAGRRGPGAETASGGSEVKIDRTGSSVGPAKVSVHSR